MARPRYSDRTGSGKPLLSHSGKKGPKVNLLEVSHTGLPEMWIQRVLGRGLVLDLGGASPFWKDLGKYRDWGDRPGVKYVCLDRQVAGRPHIVGDIQRLPIRSGCVEAIICKAVLEHVAEPWLAIREMYRVLGPEGIAFVYVPFLYPYHAAGGSYGDYYRFTVDAIVHLFVDFQSITVQPLDGYVGTVFRFLFGFGRMKGSLALPLRLLRCVASRVRGRAETGFQASGYNILAVK